MHGVTIPRALLRGGEGKKNVAGGGDFSEAIHLGAQERVCDSWRRRPCAKRGFFSQKGKSFPSENDEKTSPKNALCSKGKKNVLPKRRKTKRLPSLARGIQKNPRFVQSFLRKAAPLLPP